MNTNRLFQVIRWNLIANKKKIGSTVIGGFIGLFIASLLGTGALWTREAPSEGTVSGISTAFFIIVGLVTLHYAASICWNMKTKTDYVNYAMLPATKAEKFWANWFYSTVIMISAAFLGIAAADIVQALYTLIFSGVAHSYLLCILQKLFVCDEMDVHVYSILFTVLGLVHVHSTFVLGGCFFRKHQTLFTALMWVFVPTFISVVIGGIGTAIMWFLEDNNYSLQFEWLLTEGWGIAVATIVLVALIVFDYWLAFRLFKKMQIINNKFFN